MPNFDETKCKPHLQIGYEFLPYLLPLDIPEEERKLPFTVAGGAKRG